MFVIRNSGINSVYKEKKSMEFQFCKIKNVLWEDGGDSCIAMCMYLMPINCTLRNGLNGKLYMYTLQF